MPGGYGWAVDQKKLTRTASTPAFAIKSTSRPSGTPAENSGPSAITPTKPRGTVCPASAAAGKSRAPTTPAKST